MKKTSWPGNWKVVCDVCGFWFPSGEVKKRWDGLIVCKKDFEVRHPQTLYKYHQHTHIPDPVRTEPEDEFVLVCDIASSSAYADLAEADCAKADNTQFTYDFLLDFLGRPRSQANGFYCTNATSSAYADLAGADCSQADYASYSYAYLKAQQDAGIL